MSKKKVEKETSNGGARDQTIAAVSLVLLAFQFGFQAISFKSFLSKEVTRTSVLLMTEVAKCVIAFVLMSLSGDIGYLKTKWSLSRSFTLSAMPACVYAIQNMSTTLAYQNLDALSFNLLNQTKILFTALGLYVAMNKRQSPVQMFALILLMASAVLVSYKPEEISDDVKKESSFWWGIVPVLVSAVLSGLAATLCQLSFQSEKDRPTPLFTVELAFYGSMFLISSLVFSPDGEKTLSLGFFHGWTVWTFVPIVLQAAGGIIVGLVTRYAGSVKKGFAVVFGVLISGFAEWVLFGRVVRASDWIALGLVMTATWLHGSYPYVGVTKKDQ